MSREGTLVVKLQTDDWIQLQFGDVCAKIIYGRRKGNEIALVIKAPKDVKIVRSNYQQHATCPHGSERFLCRICHDGGSARA